MQSCFFGSSEENASDVPPAIFADKENANPGKMTMQQFCLRWNNHQPNFISVFSNLLHSETLTDVTLAAEGRHLQAHKVVLSACSSYFQSLFTINPCQHPIVILKDVKFSDLKIIIDFMYYGEVNVLQDQLTSIIKTAESLKVKGLAEMHSASFSKWPSESRGERAESCSPSSAPQSPSYRRKRMRKSSAGSNSGDKSEEVQEITLVATNTVKPEPLLISHDAAAAATTAVGNSKRAAKPSTDSQESIDEDQISIISNMENSSAATPVHNEASMQDLNQHPSSNMSQSSITSQPSHQESGLDQEFFDFMTDDVIKELLPEMGLRLKFKRKYEEFKNKIGKRLKSLPQVESPQVMDTQTTSETIQVTPSTSAQSMDEFIVDMDDSLFVESKDLEKMGQESVPIPQEQNNSMVNYPHVPEEMSFQSCSNFQLEEVGGRSSTRRNNMTLKELLISDSTGREILKMYEKTNKIDRAKLATVIIRSETEHDPDIRIRADRFHYWSQEIVALFPNENKDTYFIPYSRGPDGPISARGILFSKYTNRRRSLRGKGILEPKKVKGKRATPECIQGELNNELQMENDLWLKQNTSPREEVIEKWGSSCRVRWSNKDNLLIEDYFDTYRCLRQSYGHILIDIDFRFLHGDISNRLQSIWPNVAQKLISYGLKETSAEVKNFLTMYISEIEEGNVQILALMLMPLLMKTVPLKTTPHFRPAREQVQKNFVLHISDICYIGAALDERRRFLMDYKLSDHPVPVIVGSMSEIKSTYVIYKDAEYMMESPLKAIETCFELFFAHNAEYPKISEHIWLFFEKYIFNIKRPYVPNYVSSNALASELGLS